MEQADPGLEAEKARLKAVRDFFYHLMVFVVVCALFVIVDTRAGTGDQAVLGLDWAYWVILFWGLGIMGHAVWAFFGEHQVEARYARARSHDGTGG